MLKFKNAAVKIYEVLSTVFLTGMLICLFLQVFFRYVFNSPLIWTEEAARYLYVWVTFFTAGYCVHEHLHVEMTIFSNIFKGKARKALQILLNLISAACYAYIIPSGFKFFLMQCKIDMITMPIKMGAMWLAVPLGCALFVLALLIECYFIIKDWNKPAEAKGAA